MKPLSEIPQQRPRPGSISPPGTSRQKPPFSATCAVPRRDHARRARDLPGAGKPFFAGGGHAPHPRSLPGPGLPVPAPVRCPPATSTCSTCSPSLAASPSVQVRLLRGLQEQEFERIGGTQTLRVDVRVIPATNAELRREVERGRFHEDRYYRLNGLPVIRPPLRERRDDIPPLVEYFIAAAALPGAGRLAGGDRAVAGIGGVGRLFLPGGQGPLRAALPLRRSAPAPGGDQLGGRGHRHVAQEPVHHDGPA
ncbi:MAG: sigma 54-interacting transcriptional regulator [Candidatus Handelsmanbacteria bacterium]|nr:sigma 54-interacting transcriptional regulator [Candidatus Handelsmanbacteria bacterium]